MKAIATMIGAVMVFAFARVSGGEALESASRGEVPASVRLKTMTSTDIYDLKNYSNEELQAFLGILAATPTLAPDQVPRGCGGYFSLANPGNPPFPADVNSNRVWMADGIAILDDLGPSSSTAGKSQAQAAAQAAPVAQNVTAGVVLGAPSPKGASGGSGSGSTTTNIPINYGTNLWLAQVHISSGNLLAIASNTISDVPYQIQAWSNLAETTNWESLGFIYGSETTNWTPLTPVPFSRTNNLFIGLQSYQSEDGSGLPTWWESKYFGTNAVDPNAQDSAQDGWTIYQKFIMGIAPNVPIIPPTPQGIAAALHQSSQTATISWVPSPGAVTGYTLEKTDSYTSPATVQTFSLSASTTTYADNLSGNSPDPFYPYGNNYAVSYRLKANYISSHTSPWTATLPLQQPTVSASLNPGANGSASLEVSGVPANAASVQLVFIDMNAVYNGDLSFNYTEDVAVSSLTNGVYAVPSSWLPPATDAYGGADYWVYAETVDAQGNDSGATFFDGRDGSWPAPYNWGVPFYDGRIQLKQNLIFQLRAAPVDGPFHFSYYANGTYNYPTNYACESFYNYAAYQGFDVFFPFEENYMFRNFVFDQPDSDQEGDLTTGAGLNLQGLESTTYQVQLETTPTYQFQTSYSNYPAILATNSTRWLFYDEYNGDDSVLGLGLVDETNTYSSDGFINTNTVSMANNRFNFFGLPYTTVNIAGLDIDTGGLLTNVLAAGHSIKSSIYQGLLNIYTETAQPLFKTAGYDFWRAGAGIPLPGSSLFSPTNQSELLIIPLNNNSDIRIAGYAKLEVTNGAYSGVYGYLGQYFQQAYQISSNGVITTNTTGVLSPYGDFFPTRPGPAALVTMPDLDTGAQGTCTVYAVSLQLDKNHDTNMANLSFNSPDATSSTSPMQFWVNNNFDRWATNTSLGGALYTDVEQDDQQIAFCPAYPGTPTPDCNYSNVLANGYAYRAIPCTRDLQDFFRLWVCGIDTNLIAKLPAGSTITLNWGDVGSPNSGNPTIDLFTAADPDGGIGYLTNETVATAQINPIQCPYIGRLAPGGSIQLNASQFNGWAGSHFIMCGVNYGNGGLNLTITDGSGNVLAQSTTYLQILDIKQMYERWTVGDNPNITATNVPYLATENLPPFTPAFRYTQPQDTNTTYILHVHGFNMPTWTKDRYAETEFKRLYWQGYHGRFGEFRWPTTVQGVLNFNTAFDDSEFNSWKSAKGLLNLLTNLNSQYPGKVYLTAHSHGNVVAGEALRLAGNNQVVNTYIAMQGAVPAHSYDPTAPIRLLNSTGMNRDSGTPNCYAQYYTTGAPCYFNSSVGAGTYVNFFNTNDWALTTLWEPDQDLKPDIGQGYGYDGTHFYQNPIFPLYLLFPVDTYTIFSFCDEARCWALGAQMNVGGAFLNISGYDQVALPGVWPPDTLTPARPYSTHVWHSAEFRSDNPQRWLFWDTALFQMGLKKSL